MTNNETRFTGRTQAAQPATLGYHAYEIGHEALQRYHQEGEMNIPKMWDPEAHHRLEENRRGPCEVVFLKVKKPGRQEKRRAGRKPHTAWLHTSDGREDRDMARQRRNN